VPTCHMRRRRMSPCQHDIALSDNGTVINVALVLSCGHLRNHRDFLLSVAMFYDQTFYDQTIRGK